MRLFTPFYQYVMQWSQRPRAFYYLLSLSFMEASFFPVPPDVLLAPMTLAKPRYGWRYTIGATLASVLGALLGYMFGIFAIKLIYPLLVKGGYIADYQVAVNWFQKWGGWALLIAALTPIPYKIFTVAAGALHLSLTVFIVASFLGRFMRFGIEVAVIVWFGQSIDRIFLRYSDYIGWAVLLLIAFSCWYYYY